MLSEEFIAFCTSIDDEKANNEWFFLLGSQNETESRNSLIRELAVDFIDFQIIIIILLNHVSGAK